MQSTKLKSFTTKKDKISNILNLQNGNRGFGNLSKGVIVTSDLNILNPTRSEIKLI